MKKRDIENAFVKHWRAAIAWAFVVIILFDFVVAPSIVLGMIKAGIAIAPWVPLTMDGSGTFYLAIGAILGAVSWQKGREEIENVKRSYDFGKDDGPSEDPGPPQ
jgi:hypothetical protein